MDFLQELGGGAARVPFFFPSGDPVFPAFYGLDAFVLCRSETPQLFTVLPEKRTATVGGAMMGSTHIYDMSTVGTQRTLLWGFGKRGSEGFSWSVSLEVTGL